MLSRLAESVFRVGAAVERTDLVARLLDVHLQRIGDVRSQGERVVCRELRSIAGAAPGPDARDGAATPDGAAMLDRAATLDALAVDRHEPASIAHAVATARDDARRAREVVSTELWECLNTTRSRMPRKISGERAHEFLGWVRERSALAVGVVESDASRDEVWDFFALGRSLERIEVTARMLRSDLLDPGSAASWSLALRACGAAEAYQREHHQPVRASSAAAFLLLDDRCPRAVLFSVRRAGECLADVAADDLPDAARGLAAVEALLEGMRPAEAVDVTRDVAAQLVTTVVELREALDERVFAAGVAH